MTYQITVQPGGQRFTADASESLLDAALRNGYTLPYGCKDGACGACRGKIVSGTVDHGKSLESALTPAERASGMALYCCAQARSDLVIEARQITSSRDFPVKTLPARIEKMELAAPDVMILWLKLPATENFQFHAGQYLDILLKDGRKRSFSMANAPTAGALVELHVRHVPGGLFTEQVFSTTKVRDILRFSGPIGSFYLRDDSTKPVILLAGGTGFAPIKAIVEQAIASHSTRPLHIYWGARSQADLYLPALGEAWTKAHPDLRYTPVLSEPAAGDAWSGRTGLVHQAVMADYPDLSGHQVYACGAPAMIDAARADFTSGCKLPTEEFFADAFTFANS